MNSYACQVQGKICQIRNVCLHSWTDRSYEVSETSSYIISEVSGSCYVYQRLPLRGMARYIRFAMFVCIAGYLLSPCFCSISHFFERAIHVPLTSFWIQILIFTTRKLKWTNLTLQFVSCEFEANLLKYWSSSELEVINVSRWQNCGINQLLSDAHHTTLSPQLRQAI